MYYVTVLICYIFKYSYYPFLPYRCWFRVLDQLWLDVLFLMGTFLFCFMFVLDLALFCVLVVSASVDALVQNWVDGCAQNELLLSIITVLLLLISSLLAN